MFSADALNQKDPFTHTSISELGDDILYLQLRLSGTVTTETFAVHQPSFEAFVQSNTKDSWGNVDKLTISGVECDDGKTRDLTLDWQAWVESILPSSRVLRMLYFKKHVSEKDRETKLASIKKDLPDLWRRITYWVADCMESDALTRLEMLCEDGAPPPYMSPCRRIRWVMRYERSALSRCALRMI
jgi:hypothetical protein